MEREMILSELEKTLKNTIGEGYDVKKIQVRKNNGVLLRGISIKREGGQIAVNVYVDDLIEAIAKSRMTIAEAVKRFFGKLEEINIPGDLGDISEVRTRNIILSNVEYQVVNKRRNKELVDKIPHRQFLDLLVIYRVVLDSDEFGVASYIVNNDMVESIGIKMEELDKAAYINTMNTGFETKTLQELMAEIAGGLEEIYHEEEVEQKTYILTNKRRMNGASVLLYSDVFGRLADELQDDLFVIPSSIHEVIAVPASPMDPDELAVILRDVNIGNVAETEILGYQVYKYSRNTGQLSIER